MLVAFYLFGLLYYYIVVILLWFAAQLIRNQF